MKNGNLRKSIAILFAMAFLAGCPMQSDDMQLPAGQVSAEQTTPAEKTFVLSGTSAVYTQGNVGVGTSTPEQPLHVAGNTKVEGTVFANAFSSNSPLALQTAGMTRVYVDDVTGNVGIGTTTPADALSLVGPAAVRQTLRSTDPAAITAFRLDDAAGTPGAEMSYDPTNHVVTLQALDPLAGVKILEADGAGISINAQTASVTFTGANGNSLSISGGADHRSLAVGIGNGSFSKLRFYQSFSRFLGDVGIKRDPTANDLEVAGDASKSAAGDWLANSDARIKTDVQSIQGALATLDRVRLVTFRYTPEYRAAHPDLRDRSYMNVIAQEFRDVFPDHVQGSGERLATGEEILQVDPYPLTIYSAAAVQELHALVKKQQAQIEEQGARLAKLEARLSGRGESD